MPKKPLTSGVAGESQKEVTRGQMFASLLVFVATSSFAVIVNGLVLRHGIDLRLSISCYVGMETFSALIFAFTNFYVAFILLRWLYAVGESLKMPKVFYILLIIIVVTLVGLSVCPLGYFDRQGAVSVPSRIHEICSRTMFGSMALLAFLLQTKREVLGKIKVWSVVYVCFAGICALGCLLRLEWFLKWFLIFEASYIVGFMVLATSLRPKKLLNNKMKEK